MQAVGLGLGHALPRCLRWGGPVTLSLLGQQQLEQQLHSLWQAKAQHDARLPHPCPLHHFLWLHFWAETGGDQAAVAESCYALLHALQQCERRSAAAGLFLRVLQGAWGEGLVRESALMLQELAELLEGLGEPLHGLPTVQKCCVGFLKWLPRRLWHNLAELLEGLVRLGRQCALPQALPDWWRS